VKGGSRESMRDMVIGYVKRSHKRTNRVPSSTDIVRELHDKGLNLALLYDLFPGGMKQICELAKVPIPSERINKTSQARNRQKTKSHIPSSDGAITLTPDQTQRLLGISHLEGGRDLSMILQEMFDRDTERRKLDISLEGLKLTNDFLLLATKVGWSIKKDPNILTAITTLWNKDIQNLPPETVDGLISLLTDLKNRKWNPSDFVSEITNSHNAAHWFMKYKRGEIGGGELKERLGSIA